MLATRPSHTTPLLPPPRFEALCTGQAVADATSEFGVLVRARVGAQRLLLGAEVDCFDPGRGGAAPAPGSSSGSGSGEAAGSAAQQAAGGAPPLGSLVELKTYRLPVHAGQQRSLHRWKHPKWWLQSFLAGAGGPRRAGGFGRRLFKGQRQAGSAGGTAHLLCRR